MFIEKLQKYQPDHQQYKYFTGEEILRFNQKQITEKGKFTYSPLGKAFKKQIKTIEDHGEKQIDAIRNQEEIETIKKYGNNDKGIPLIWKKGIFNKLVDEKLDEITKLDKKINSDDLTYRYKSLNTYTKFTEFDNALDHINKIREDKTSLGEIKKVNKKRMSKDKKAHWCY